MSEETWKNKIVPANFLFSGKGPWNITNVTFPVGFKDIGSQIKQNNNLNFIQKLLCFKEKDMSHAYKLSISEDL